MDNGCGEPVIPARGDAPCFACGCSHPHANLEVERTDAVYDNETIVTLQLQRQVYVYLKGGSSQDLRGSYIALTVFFNR